MDEKTISDGENFLAHYGKKGMHWGQRSSLGSDLKSGGAFKTDKDIKKANDKWVKQNVTMRSLSKIRKSAEKDFRKNEFSKIKRELKTNPRLQVADKQLKSDIYNMSVATGLKNTLNSHGRNFGKTQAGYIVHIEHDVAVNMNSGLIIVKPRAVLEKG